MGSDHGYGLAWFEQKMAGGKRTFVKHWIETEYPTFHTMALADLDGDGKPELITGKQLLAHNGGDVGALDPVFVFYYKFHKGRFERHILSYSYLEPYFAPGYKEPPPNYVIGVGMRLSTADLDGDGRTDVVVAARSGLYVFFNKGYCAENPRPEPAARPRQLPGQRAVGGPQEAPRHPTAGRTDIVRDELRGPESRTGTENGIDEKTLHPHCRGDGGAL